jgi:ferredoxin
MFRISGRAQKLGDQRRWIDEIFNHNPSMNDVYPRDSRYILEPFCIRIEQMEWFDLGVSPICRGEISLSTEKGFVIGPNCIGCGKCMRSCPQQCICAGSPYQIAQEHCLHCGLCAETCPVHAILPGGERA